MGAADGVPASPSASKTAPAEGPAPGVWWWRTNPGLERRRQWRLAPQFETAVIGTRLEIEWTSRFSLLSFRPSDRVVSGVAPRPQRHVVHGVSSLAGRTRGRRGGGRRADCPARWRDDVDQVLPSRSSAKALARPIPDPPPVTRTTFPSSVPLMARLLSSPGLPRATLHFHATTGAPTGRAVVPDSLGTIGPDALPTRWAGA